MAGPLVLLAVFAVCVGWTFPSWSPGVLSRLGIENLLDTARPVGQLGDKPGALLTSLVIPDEHDAHLPRVKVPAGWSAISVALAGIIGASIVYLWEIISAASLRRYLNLLYHATWNKWWFDELYDFIFVRPSLAISRFIALVLDRGIIDSILHGFAYLYRGLAAVVAMVGDRFLIDNTVDTVAETTWDLGLSLRSIQTGQLRQYVMFIVVCTIALFIIATLWWRVAIAG
jgi:NADH-quinone oxidoreductase subunit L